MDLSTRLSYLFGTKEYVDVRRQLNNLRETLWNYQIRQKKIFFVCSGSLGEGVAYPKSDDDVMLCSTYLRVVQTYREATQRGDFLMLPSEYSPGYCLLLDLFRTSMDFNTQIMDEIPCFSSSLFKQRLCGGGYHIHGPCFSQNIGTLESDMAFSISCYNWPDKANGWVMRNRSNGWPSTRLIQKISRNGCLVVPVGDPASPYGQHEWRMSLSVAERTLMHSFNHSQYLVYNLLRLTLKRIIGKTVPEVLCSYFMKTTLFYTAENTPKEHWQEDNLDICFKSCISVLYDYVDHRYCPNYFIPEFNMIKRKINYTNRQQILDIIRTIYNIGIVGVLHLSGEYRCMDARLSAREMEWKLDVDFMLSMYLSRILLMIDKIFLNLPYEITECCPFNLYKYWFLLKNCPVTGDLIRTIWNKGIQSYCFKVMDYLFTLSGMNRFNYHGYKSLETLLTIGFRGDVTTGKLTMATYMYMSGKTESASRVLRLLLSEYPPYVVEECGCDDSLKRQAYIEAICGKGYTIGYK